MHKIFQFTILIIIVFFAGSSAIFPQTANFEALEGMGETKYHRIDYQPLEQTYHIYVRLPENREDDKQYPVIYLLDGGVTFPLLGAYYQYLSYAKEAPPAIIVGISYGTSDWQNGNNRSRDFTAESAERDYWGGAENFTIFFRNTLFPLIEENYAADSTRRIIFGQSLGGQFALYAAQADTDLFWGHIASNPALHRNLDFFLKPYSGDIEKRNPKRLFVSSASEDDPRFREPALKWIQFWESVTDRPWELKAVTLPGQNHFSAAPEAFRQGLKWLFKN